MSERTVVAVPPAGGRRYGWRVLAVVLMMSAVTAGAHAADVFKGGELYKMHCAACHGPSGVSVMPGAPDFARNETLMTPDIMLLNSIKMGRNAMPAYRGILTDREILDVIAFLRTLSMK